MQAIFLIFFYFNRKKNYQSHSRNTTTIVTILGPINFAKAFHRSAVCKIISSRKNAQYSAWNTHGKWTNNDKICIVHMLFILSNSNSYVPPTLPSKQTNKLRNKYVVAYTYIFWWKQRFVSRSAHTNNQYESPILKTIFLFIYFLSIFTR